MICSSLCVRERGRLLGGLNRGGLRSLRTLSQPESQPQAGHRRHPPQSGKRDCLRHAKISLEVPGALCHKVPESSRTIREIPVDPLLTATVETSWEARRWERTQPQLNSAKPESGRVGGVDCNTKHNRDTSHPSDTGAGTRPASKPQTAHPRLH